MKIKHVLFTLLFAGFVVGCVPIDSSSVSSSVVTSNSVSTSSVDPSSSNSTTSEDTDLTEEKADAVAELNAYYATFVETDYSTENWTTLTGHLNTAVTNINNAASQAAIDLIVTTAKSNMVGIEKTVDISGDKTAAIAELTVHYETFSAVNYTTANWSLLNDIYQSAKTDIQAAATLEAIAPIVATAKTGMDNIAIKPAAGETLEIIAIDIYNDFYIRLITNQYVELLKEGSLAVKVVSSTIPTAVYFEGPYVWGTNDNAAVTIQTMGNVLTQVEATFIVKITFADDSTQEVAVVIANGQLQDLSYVKNKAVTNLDAYLAEKEYLQEKYTTENWTLLQATVNDGKAAINAATSYKAIMTQLQSSKDELDAISQRELSLDEIKGIAVAELIAHAATKVEANYSTENWNAIQTAVTNGTNAINAADSAENVELALEAAKTAIDQVTKLPKPLMIGFWNPHGVIYVQFGWSNPITNAQITKATATVKDISTGVVYPGTFHHNDGPSNKFFTFEYSVDSKEYEFSVTLYVGADVYETTIEVIGNSIKTLPAEKNKASLSLTDYMTSEGMIEAKYTAENWLLVQLTKAEGIEDIEAATTFAEIRTIVANVKTALSAIPQRDLDLENAKSIIIQELEDFVLTKNEVDYSPENWTEIQTLLASAISDIGVASSVVDVNTINNDAKTAVNAVTKLPKVLNINTWNPHGTIYLQFGWTNSFANSMVTAKSAYVKDVKTGIVTNGVFDRADGTSQMFFIFPGYTIDGSGTNEYEIVITIKVDSEVYEFRTECLAGVRKTLPSEKTKAVATLQGYPAAKGYIEPKYTVENWQTLQTAITNGVAAINAATSYAEINEALSAAKTIIDAIEQTTLDLGVAKELAITDLQNFVSTKKQTDYTEENWTALQTALTNGINAINGASSEELINSALTDVKSAINAIVSLVLPLNTNGAAWNPHGGSHVVAGWTNPFINTDIATYYASIKDLNTGTIYVGNILHNDGDKAKFFYFPGYNVEAANCHYNFTLRITLKTGEIYETVIEVTGRIKEAGK